MIPVPPQTRGTKREALPLLIGGSLAFWVLTAVPAAQLWGTAMYVNSAIAAGLCLLPTVGVLLWVERSHGLSPQLLMLGGMGLRMTVALGAGLILYVSVPALAEQGPVAFWGWLLLYYLFSLALEVVVLVQGKPRTA